MVFSPRQCQPRKDHTLHPQQLSLKSGTEFSWKFHIQHVPLLTKPYTLMLFRSQDKRPRCSLRVFQRCSFTPGKGATLTMPGHVGASSRSTSSRPGGLFCFHPSAGCYCPWSRRTKMKQRLLILNQLISHRSGQRSIAPSRGGAGDYNFWPGSRNTLNRSRSFCGDCLGAKGLFRRHNAGVTAQKTIQHGQSLKTQ